MQFTNLTTGHSHAFGGRYVELVPGERIVHTDRFDDPNLPGEMITTIALKKVSHAGSLRRGVPSSTYAGLAVEAR